MTKHLNPEQLLALCSPSGDATVPTRPAEHLEGCPACRTRLEEFRAILAGLESPALAEAPRAWVSTALGWIRAREAQIALGGSEVRSGAVRRGLGAARRKAEEILEEVRAALVLDTASGAALAGIRGSAVLQPRQMLYESPLGSVHLQVEPEGPKAHGLLGQLLPADGTIGSGGARVILEQDGKETVRRIQASGEFRFRGLAPGRYRVRFEWAGHRLVIDPLELPAGDHA